MKPRLSPAELTEEDFGICKRNSQRWWTMMGEIRPCLAPIYVVGDRRDADLMFKACLERRANPFNPAGIRESGVVCGARWQLGRVSAPGYLWLPGM